MDKGKTIFISKFFYLPLSHILEANDTGYILVQLTFICIYVNIFKEIFKKRAKYIIFMLDFKMNLQKYWLKRYADSQCFNAPNINVIDGENL